MISFMMMLAIHGKGLIKTPFRLVHNIRKEKQLHDFQTCGSLCLVQIATSPRTPSCSMVLPAPRCTMLPRDITR